MLAIVEQDQNLLVLQKGDQRWIRILRANGNAKHRRESTGHKPGILERSEVDKSCAVLVRGKQIIGHRQGNRGFADSGRSDNRNETASLQAITYHCYDIGAADQSGGAIEKITSLVDA